MMSSKKDNEFVPSQRIKFLTLDIGKKSTTYHNILIAEIAEALYKMGHTKIWYDHIKNIVPKCPLPNTINGRRWDIVVQTEPGHYALIEITMVAEPEIEIYETEEKGAENGKGKD